MTSTALTHEQLYQLNDRVTAALAELGWTPRDEDDDIKLNDAVLDLAVGFFPQRVAA